MTTAAPTQAAPTQASQTAPTPALPTPALPTQALPSPSLPTPSVLHHLSRLTDSRGLFEHALLDVPRPEHGYCVDDVARALIVVCREEIADTEVLDLCRLYLDFTLSAIQPDGSCHNRMNASGRWTDTPGTGDWWGRALWALGVTSVHAERPATRKRAIKAFERAARQESRDLHATAFAAIGAAEMLSVDPLLAQARRIIYRASAMIPDKGAAAWPWPESRLRYSNGAIPEALIAGGSAIGDRHLVARGLSLLAFLVANETLDGRLSVTGNEGRDPGEAGPMFDQQPIEVAAIADACARAYDVTGDKRWLDGVRLAWEWFLGSNDSETPMIDASTGAGYDGLTARGRNENRGAESTLAALSTFQQARRLIGAEMPR